MLYIRHRELRLKAWITFMFFIALDAIKINRETFDKRLIEIEQYLSNGDWIMTEYWVTRVMNEYDVEVGKKENYHDLGIY
jgi:hypothetical protein